MPEDSVIAVFSETGGYDCCTGAWSIRYGDRILAEVDLAEYGQEGCDYEFRSPQAEKVAKEIARALNQYISFGHSV